MMKKALFHAAFLIILLVAACRPNKPRIDTGLFSRGSCSVPCWQNLTPGVSTLDDVNRFIDSLDPADWPGRYKVDELACHRIWITDNTNPDVPSAGFEFDIQQERLSFIGVFLREQTDLEKVVQRFGSPEFFKSLLYIGPDGTGYLLDIYYPEHGLAFSVPVTPEEAGYIRPDMQMGAVEYFPPGDLTSYLTSRYSCDFGPNGTASKVQEEANYIQPWTGFGQVHTIIIDPRTTATPGSK